MADSVRAFGDVWDLSQLQQDQVLEIFLHVNEGLDCGESAIGLFSHCEKCSGAVWSVTAYVPGQDGALYDPVVFYDGEAVRCHGPEFGPDDYLFPWRHEALYELAAFLFWATGAKNRWEHPGDDQ